MIASLDIFVSTINVSLVVIPMKIVVPVNHAVEINVWILVWTVHVDQIQFAQSQIIVQVVHVFRVWLPVQQLKSVVFELQQFHVQKIVVVHQILHVSVKCVDQFVQMMLAV